MLARPERHFTIGVAVVLILSLQIWIIRGMLDGVGLSVALVVRLFLAFLALAPYFAGGIVGWIIVMAIRRELREYLRTIRSREWLVTSVLAIALNVMTTYAYAILKNSIPLLTDRNYDQLLWDLDRAMFFGLSPNVFFLNLFSSDWLIRAIDYGYGHLFFLFLTAGYPILFGHSRNDIRVAFFASSALMWSAGAWLYFAVPSLGPCYKFYGVWEDSKELFPVSTYWQYRLISNYEKVLRIREGIIDPSIDLIMGIGAFPSMHVAYHVFFALWLARLSRLWGRVGWLVAVIMFIGSVVTGWHYLVDSIAGVAIGVAAYAGSIAMLRWMGAGEPPGDPTSESRYRPERSRVDGTACHGLGVELDPPDRMVY